MVDCKAFYETLLANDISFFAGVPDSLIAPFCTYLNDRAPSRSHVIAANEGNAVALAAGHFLATGSAGLVYMQNSGLGNAVNPLASLVEQRVFDIPVLLLVGWRGEPGTNDEPQHAKQGEVTLPTLDALGIDYELLEDDLAGALEMIEAVAARIRRHGRSIALIARKGVFQPYSAGHEPGRAYELRREDVIELFARRIGPRDVVVSTTGKTSRELFEHRAAGGDRGFDRELLMVGSMGHASQIAMGIALAQPDRHVFCLDGDGALIMHMGALAVIGATKPGNFKHVVINNGAHESVGGHPTAGFAIDIPALSRACGYEAAFETRTAKELKGRLDELIRSPGPALLEIKVRAGARPDLGRPTRTPLENRERFMRFLRK